MQKVSSLSKNILFLSIMAYLIVIFLPVFSVKGTLFNIMVLLSFMGFVAAVLLDGKINYLTELMEKYFKEVQKAA